MQSYVRLTASTHIQCSTYDDAAPILSIHDGAADITITNPGKGEVTDDDVRFGRQLADAVTRYAAELATIAARNRPAAARTGPCRAGGVMATQIKAGRPELVPPAAPGLSPATGKKEVSIICAGS